MAIQKAIVILIYSYNQIVTEQYGNIAILERKKTIITLQIERILILFNIPPVAENKKGEP